MYAYETADRAHFMANRPSGVPVRVVRMPSIQVMRRDDRIARIPAIELTYSFRRDDRDWVFQETRLARGNETTIDLRDTLWAELEKAGGYELLHRSGSF
jgi:hypothetical protein